jgi:hypothetical protein
MRWLTFVVALIVCSIPMLAATIDARLIRASDDHEVNDSRLKQIEPKLKEKFGYKFYQQIGADQALLKQDTTNRLNLGEGFVLFVTPKSVTKKTHELDIEWTSGRASLVKSTVQISQGSHLFIKGPAVANDWIILALTVKE